MSNLNFGDLEADYVLTDEEMEQSRSEESMQQIQQNVNNARMERMARESEAQAAEEAAAAPTPQLEQPTTVGTQPQQPPAEPTGQPLSGETVTLGDGKTYAVEHLEYRDGIPFVKPEFNELYQDGKSYLGQPLGEMGQQVKERTSALGQGLFDFATDLANKFLPKSAKIPKVTKYEDNVAQAARAISSVVTPTIILQGAGMAAGAAAQSRVGWSLGNTGFMRFIGSRGVEAGVGAAVGAVSSEYEEDNITGSIKKILPAQWDFIPDSMATLDTDSPDIKRQKNINEDLALGFLIPFVGSIRKFDKAIGEIKGIFDDFLKPSGKTPKAQGWIDAATPAADDLDDVTRYALKQEDSLDELGAYNLSQNPNMDVALKGVHDLYDWNEVGQRTVDDFGIIGASIDAVRIAKNYDTVYGRLGSVVSPPAIKHGASTPMGSEEITLGLTKQLKDADEYGMEAKNWSIKFDDVVAQGENLAVELFDPSMGVKELRQILDPYIVKGADGVEYVAEEGYDSLFRAVSNYSDDMTGMDIARAQSYLATSLGGQIADIAEGMRINRGSRAVFNAQERIKDNLMYLMKLQGVSRYYAQKKKFNSRLFKKLEQKGITPPAVKADPDELENIINGIQKEVEVFGKDLDYLRNTYPKTAEALMELYEMTDGEINSIFKLNEDIQYTFTRFRPLYDNKPFAPNIMMQAVRGNFFNSVLSSFGTGAQALYGNLGGTIAEPITYFAGALLRKDMDSLQRGWMAYSALWDTQKRAIPYAAKLFMKASQNPNAVKGQTRLDMVIQFEEKLSAYKKIAEEQAEQGREGFKYLINQYEMMKQMEQDPVFRFIPNTFTGLDGWTNATIANAHARFRAMSELKRLGEDATPARIKELADAEYNSMFDANGIIADKAVRYNSNEITLNLDTDMVKGFDDFLRLVPGARMFLMFPGTMANIIKQVDDYAPPPLKTFQKDINELAYTSVSDIAGNPALMDQLLSSRGFDPSTMDEGLKLETIIDLKNKTLGKKAIGTFITGTIVTGLFFGTLEMTGDGLYDRSAQRSREANSDWERRTIKVGNKRISYETILGPGLANWVAAVVNVADNFDMIGESITEKAFEKLAFTLGGAITNQALISALRPLVELAAGNGFEASRFSAGMINSLGPLGGLRNEMGRVLDGGLKIIDEDIKAHMANRNQIVGVLDPANRLPYIYSPVTGKIPNKYNLATRVWNSYSPIKVYPGQSPEEKFLQDIEFDISTTFKKRKGVKLLPAERSELFRLMGERGYFRERIAAIMRSAKARNTIERLREARKAGVSSEETSLDDFDLVHYDLGVALREAEQRAFEELDSDMRIAIEARRQAALAAKAAAEGGRIPALEEAQNMYRR